MSDGAQKEGREEQGQEPQASASGQPSGDQRTEGTQPAEARGPGQEGGEQTSPEGRTQSGFEFTHPHLQGRSPEEIQSLYTRMQGAVQEQGQKLNQLSQQQQQAQGQQPSGQAQGQQSGFPDIENDEFFDRPVDAVREISRAAIREALDETIKPLNQQLQQVQRQNQVDQLVQRYRNQYPDFERVRPYMETIAAQTNVNISDILANENITAVVYRAARDLMREDQESQQRQQPQQQQPQQAQGPPQGVPQHRPSSAPMPQQGQGQKQQVRELTEQERQLAAAWKMTPEEFIRWQEADARDVAQMEG